jgi:hypothetical protein
MEPVDLAVLRKACSLFKRRLTRLKRWHQGYMDMMDGIVLAAKSTKMSSVTVLGSALEFLVFN